MIMQSEAEQFLREYPPEIKLPQIHSLEFDSDSEMKMHQCFSSMGEDCGLEIITFSTDMASNAHKTRFLKKVETSFTATDFRADIVEPLKPEDHPTHSLAFFDHWNQGVGIQDLSISPQTLNSIAKGDLKSRSILAKGERAMTQVLRKSILNVLKSHFLFSSFGEEAKTALIDNLACFPVEKGHTILQEGEFGECLYFIEKGSVLKLKKGRTLSEISKENIIGEEMILSINALTCSYLAREKCVLWGINCKVLAKIMLSMNEEKYKENRRFLEPLSFFSSLSETQKDELSYNLTDVKYLKGKVIIEERDHAEDFFIIKEGSVFVTQKNNFLYNLVKGDSFGDNFFSKSKRNFTVTAETNFVSCLCISKKTFKRILGKNAENLVINGNVRTMLRKSFFFSKISPVALEKVFKQIRVECLLSQTVITSQPEKKDPQVIFIADGALASIDLKTTYTPGLILFEELFFDENQEYPAELVAVEDSIVGFISKKEIESVIGMKIKDVFRKEHWRKNRYSSVVIEPRTSEFEIDPHKITIIKEIGEGASGLVFLVKYEHSFYALKVISKGWVMENKLESYIRNEKKIHQKIAFPFITSMVTTWKDDISIYFLMEYIKGRDLFEVYHCRGALEISEIIFLAASLILTLEHIHLRGIIHRDLKPENIIVNNEGYLKVCDLGFGKILLSKSDRSYTIVGTHHYMSPEMILGKGYSFLVDYWSLGVILYESFYGKLPFAEGVEDPYLISEEIVKKKLVFPKEIRNKDVKALIQQFLSKSPEKRLGVGGVDELKALKVFGEISWEDLLERNVESPFNMFMNFTKDFVQPQCHQCLTLAEALEAQEIQSLKEITEKLVSDYKDWDDIF